MENSSTLAGQSRPRGIADSLAMLHRLLAHLPGSARRCALFVRVSHCVINSRLTARSVEYVGRFELRNHNMLAEP